MNSCRNNNIGGVFSRCYYFLVQLFKGRSENLHENNADMNFKDIYRSEDGDHFFEFNFVWLGQYFEIDIQSMPALGNRSADLHITHRLPSARGGHKICFGDPKVVPDSEAARKWAKIWSECIVTYIKTGEHFPNG